MRYAHTNIVAKDWQKLSDFYINVFGCTIKPPERKLSGDWLDQATGLSKAELEGVHLLLPGHGDSGPTLEIFSYKDTHECEPVMAKYRIPSSPKASPRNRRSRNSQHQRLTFPA